MRLEWSQNKLTIVAPWSLSNQAILAFLFSKKSWISKQVRKSPIIPEKLVCFPSKVRYGSVIPYLGTGLKLIYAPQLKAPNIQHKKLYLPYSENILEQKVMMWLETRACKLAMHIGTRVGRKLNAHPRSIKIKRLKSIWGSCGIRNDIHLNWQLVCFPKDVFEYVIIHEYSHLFVRSHSKAFYAKVKQLMPDYREKERWLAKFGPMVCHGAPERI